MTDLLFIIIIFVIIIYLYNRYFNYKITDIGQINLPNTNLDNATKSDKINNIVNYLEKENIFENSKPNIITKPCNNLLNKYISANNDNLIQRYISSNEKTNLEKKNMGQINLNLVDNLMDSSGLGIILPEIDNADCKFPKKN